jgi:tRNA(Arg) A34 adenosine deaminase TadA
VFEQVSGRLLAVGVNRVVASGCSTAHAEVLALALAQQAQGGFDLGAPGQPACELVSSAEPCLMCLGATLWSGVRHLVYGATDADVRTIGFDEGPKPADWAGEFRRRGIEVTGPLLRPRAAALLRAYRDGGGMIYNARAGSV